MRFAVIFLLLVVILLPPLSSFYFFEPKPYEPDSRGFCKGFRPIHFRRYDNVNSWPQSGFPHRGFFAAGDSERKDAARPQDSGESSAHHGHAHFVRYCDRAGRRYGDARRRTKVTRVKSALSSGECGTRVEKPGESPSSQRAESTTSGSRACEPGLKRALWQRQCGLPQRLGCDPRVISIDRQKTE